MSIYIYIYIYIYIICKDLKKVYRYNRSVFPITASL